MFGTGATEHDGFSSLAARALQLRHDNRAESGSLSTDTARLVVASPPPPASLFVLMTGLNDARLDGPSTAARVAYAEAVAVVLDAFRRASPTAPVLVLEQPYIDDYSGHPPFHRASDAVIDAYNSTLRQCAARHPSTSVVATEGWEVTTMVSADGVHPNDVGHRHLAEVVVRALAVRKLSPVG